MQFPEDGVMQLMFPAAVGWLIMSTYVAVVVVEWVASFFWTMGRNI